MSHQERIFTERSRCQLNMTHFSLVFLVSLILAPVSAIEQQRFVSGSAPRTAVELSSDNFRTAIHDSANPLWLLDFYAPW